MSLAIDVTNDALEVGFIEDLFALSSAKKESVAAEIVDSASDSFGVLEDTADKAIT